MEKIKISKISLIVVSIVTIVFVLGGTILLSVLKRNGAFGTENSGAKSSAASQISSSSAVSRTVSGTESATASAVSHQISVTGDVFEGAESYAKRAYELAFLFGIQEFGDPNTLPVSATVQYAFCHLYHDSLTDMPRSTKMVFREVLEESIVRELKKQFGDAISLDVKKSDLYNPETKTFQMWEPKLAQSVFSATTVEKKSGDVYQLTSQFYENGAKSKPKGGAVTLLLKKQGTGYIITGLHTNNS